MASETAVEMSLLAVLRRRNGQIGGDEGAGFVRCGQKLLLLEVGWRRGEKAGSVGCWLCFFSFSRGRESLWRLAYRGGKSSGGGSGEEGRNGVGQEVCVGLGENLRKWGEGGAAVFGLFRYGWEREGLKNGGR